MGWVYAFDSLDPAVIRDIMNAPTAELRQRLVERGVPPEQVGVESWDAEEFDENEALVLLATTQRWYVDKSLDEIRAVARLDAALRPVEVALRDMEDHRASMLPARFHPREVGLMGIALSEAVQAAAAAIAPFTTQECRFMFGQRSSFLQRILGRGVRQRLSSSDYLWQNWTAFGQALQTAAERKEWLGLHMS